MPNEKPEVYEGDRDYIFACYSHDDRDAVLPIIGALMGEGYRTWYDDGIELAGDYPEHIAYHVCRCACLVMFVSRASLGSDWRRDEVNYAHNLGKKVLPVYLEDVELTSGLQMRLGQKQALFWYEYDTDEDFYEKLFMARWLDSCLTDEGRRRRGAKPKTPTPGASSNGGEHAPHEPQAEQGRGGNKTSGVEGVARKAALAEYSWVELKALSRAIAEAGSNAEGLAIAKAYGLVNEDGELQGDTKELELIGGPKSKVRILGFRHDDLAGDKGKAGISFEFADVPETHRMNPVTKRGIIFTYSTNAGGWKKSEMRGWLNEEFLAKLPDDLRPLLAAASKRTNNKGKVGRKGDVSVVSATEDKLWLLSMSEVYGRLSAQAKNVPWSPATYDAEGTQYQIYKDYKDKGVSTTNYAPCIKKNVSGAGSWWRLRSPFALYSDYFLVVNSGGDWFDWNGANCGGGVSPGFCF